MITLTPPMRNIKGWMWPNKLESIDELIQIITRRGQFYGQDISGPACNYDPAYSCDHSLYEALGLKGHNGLDIPVNHGEPIIASHDGMVLEVGDFESAGLGVVLWNKENNFKTIYWHFKENHVKVGDVVKREEVIGLGDNTGLSSGDHLHYGLKETDNKGKTINWGNGFKGAIDPLPYLVWFDEDMTLTEGLLDKLYLSIFHRHVDDEGRDYWKDKTLDQFLDGVLASEEMKFYDPLFKAGKGIEKWANNND